MAYYVRLGDSYVACSSFGMTGILPSLSAKKINEFKTAGYANFNEQKSCLVQTLEGHVLFMPELPQLPRDVLDQVHRIGSLSIFSTGKFRLYPHEQLDQNSAQELLHLGLSRNFLYGSFFKLNTGILVDKSFVLCPHAHAELLNNELRSIVLSILGSSGHALAIQDNSCFCVFYSHTVVDTELIVTQIARTLLRSISSKDSSLSLGGPSYSVKLSDERSESGLRSFVETVEPRLHV